MDWGHDERDYAAGHSDQAPRLAPEAWAGMIANIRAIAELARDRHGVRAVIHPHAGGYLEFEDELERVVEDVPRDVAGLCLDTGHLDYSGMDPVETLRRHALRTDYIHFKDIDAFEIRRCHGATHPVLRRLRRGCHVPDRSRPDRLSGLHELLTEIGYGGYITIEQERDPRNANGVLADLAASRDFLRRAGF